MNLFKRHKHTYTYPSGKEQKPLIVSGYGLTEYMNFGFNSAINLCNAHLIKKLDAEEIERIVISCKKQTEASCPHCNKNSTWTQINSYELSQAIITHLTGKGDK